MKIRTVFLTTSLIAAVSAAGAGANAAEIDPDKSVEVGVEEEAPRAAKVAEEGQLLPQTFSATIGHKQVIGLFTGGYDSAADQGPQFGALV